MEKAIETKQKPISFEMPIKIIERDGIPVYRRKTFTGFARAVNKGKILVFVPHDGFYVITSSDIIR